MPYPDELMIGAYADGVEGMVAVSTLGEGVYSHAIVEGAFTVNPMHYSAVVALADGSELEAGWLECDWHIGGLRAEQYDDLISYRTSHTTQLYIRTLDNDGATYKNFLVKAIFPVMPNRGDPMAGEAGAVFDFAIRFIQAVEVPE